MTSLNGVPKRRLTAKETSIASCEVLDEKCHITVQGIFSVNRLVVCLRFFLKNKPGKLVSSLVGCLLLFLKIYVFIRRNLPSKILRQRKNRNFSKLNLSVPSQNNKTSRTSCCCLFENFLPSTPTEITCEISLNPFAPGDFAEKRVLKLVK